MTRFLPVAGMVFAALWMAGGEQHFAQAQSQSQSQSENSPAPTADAPQPQKKQAAKTPPPADSAAGSETPSSSSGSSGNSAGSGSSSQAVPSPSSSTANDNPFPEDVSRRAAKQEDDAPPSPEPSSPKPDPNAAHTTAGANPFPEAVSRQAAKASGGASSDTGENHQENQDKQQLPPGVSSSQSSSILGDSDSGLPGSGAPGKSLEITNPSRAKKDTQVGDFYLQREDAKGAYLRYQDAIRFDPTNVDAIFGIAEAARMLGKSAEAEHNYQLYLEIIPSGPKAKRALKALESLSSERQTPASGSH